MRSGRYDPAVIDTVIFDLGNVLIPWDRFKQLRTFTSDEVEIRRLGESVITLRINERLDEGEPWAKLESELVRDHPEDRDAIRHWWDHWPLSIGPVNQDVVDVVRGLKAADFRCVALTNFSAETFDRSLGLGWFASLIDLFDDVVVSGREGVTKPSSEIFELALRRWGVTAGRCVFIDDSPANVMGARSSGLTSIQFTSAPALLAELADLGIYPRGPACEL